MDKVSSVFFLQPETHTENSSFSIIFHPTLIHSNFSFHLLAADVNFNDKKVDLNIINLTFWIKFQLLAKQEQINFWPFCDELHVWQLRYITFCITSTFSGSIKTRMCLAASWKASDEKIISQATDAYETFQETSLPLQSLENSLLKLHFYCQQENISLIGKCFLPVARDDKVSCLLHSWRFRSSTRVFLSWIFHV